MTGGKAKLTRHGEVAIVTLSDPATRNALSWDMADTLRKLLQQLGDARALLICAEGKGFCSGGDMTMEGAGQPAFGAVLDKGLDESVNPLMRELADLDIPVVNAVNGAAAGAGASLALSADFVIAAQNSFFLFAFPKVGLAVDAGASWLLPRLVGMARATRALMLAERISADQALEWGMIHAAVPQDELFDHALKLAEQLADGPTVAYGQIRKALRQGQHVSYEEALETEREAQRTCGDTDDCLNAVASFRDKQEPVFRGS